MSESESLWQWMPVALEERAGVRGLVWRFVGEHRFVQPFFEDSLAMLPRGEGMVRWEPLGNLSWLEGADCVAPSAFVFHASRCGSTLITQLLAQAAKCIAISEAPVVDEALGLLRSGTDRGAAREVLRGVVRALGQRRAGVEEHLIVKLDSWHITQLPVIREVFPGVPLYFVYRHPAEILASHRRQRGRQMVPLLMEPEEVGLDSAAVDGADLDGYGVRVLSSFLEAAWRGGEEGRLRLVNYSQMPGFVTTEFVEELSISLGEGERKDLEERATRHAKRWHEEFDPRAEPSAAGLDTEEWRGLLECYDGLERRRLEKCGGW